MISSKLSFILGFRDKKRYFRDLKLKKPTTRGQWKEYWEKYKYTETFNKLPECIDLDSQYRND